MAQFTMGFPIFLTLVLFIAGKAVEANPMDRCMELMKFEEEMDNYIKLAGEEQLNVFCRNMTAFLRCTNDVLREQTGFDLKEMADLFQGTDIGKALTILVNLQDLVEEVCTDGTQLREDYLRHAQCYRDIDIEVVQDCEKQAKDAYETFKELQSERSPNRSRPTQVDEPCTVAAYQLGCLGAAVHEECGDDAFETYKEFVRKVGLFKSGVCSEELMHTLKTSFVESLDISESRKSLYRVILDLKRRRK